MVKRINIAASELAKLTGDNTYDDPRNVINSILSKNNIEDIYIPKSNLERTLLSLSEEELAKLRSDLNVQSTNIQDIVVAINKGFVEESYNKHISEDESKEMVDKKLPASMKQLNSSIKQDLRMRRGNTREDMNLDKTQRKNSVDIGSRNSKMYQKILYTDPDGLFEINIRGKVDGISGERIIEAKNRNKYLFMKLRGYERVQLETYMFLTGMQKSTLVEYYNETSNEIEYDHDESYWNECSSKVINFIQEHIATKL